MLTQPYLVIPKNLRRQAKAILVWYPNERTNLKMIHDENNLLTNGELFFFMSILKTPEHAYLYIIDEHPHDFKVPNHVLDDNSQF